MVFKLRTPPFILEAHVSTGRTWELSNKNPQNIFSLYQILNLQPVQLQWQYWSTCMLKIDHHVYSPWIIPRLSSTQVKGTQSCFCACTRFWFLDRLSQIQRFNNYYRAYTNPFVSSSVNLIDFALKLLWIKD